MSSRDETPRKAVDADVPAVAVMLAEAFEDYPWTRWIVDAADHRARLEALQRLAIERLAMPDGEVWLIGPTRDVHSAAVWVSPDAPVPAAVIEDVSRRSAVLGGTHYQRAVDAERAITALRPRTPHYLLGAVGTLPTRRRLGLAEAVLRPVLARASEQGVDAYLETSTESNLAFYSRLGFKALWHETLHGGGPQVCGMVRSRPWDGAPKGGCVAPVLTDRPLATSA